MAADQVQHGKCGRRFAANRSHCGGCCETFIALSHFEAHRQGPQSKHPWTCTPFPSTLGFELRNGVWGPPESHDNLVATGARLRRGREAAPIHSQADVEVN